MGKGVEIPLFARKSTLRVVTELSDLTTDFMYNFQQPPETYSNGVIIG